MSHPVQRVDGYAGWKSTYDDRGNEIAADYFDETGRPARFENGYSRITWSYDDRDRKVAQAYFDALGRPLRLKNGLAAMTLNFDDRGNRIEEAYFDELGRPTQPEYGPARATMKYDARNNEIEQAYFDGNGLPMRNSQGLAAWKGVYDDRDNLIKRTYLDEASHPVRHKQYGYASWTASFDDRDKQIEEAYFDETGARATDRRGVARWVAQYNDRGQEVGRLLYDTAGKLLESRILVGDIDAGSQAERLGLKKGDVVLSYGGNEVHDRDEFIKQRSREPAGGKPQELIVLRDGKRVPFLVKPGLLGAGLANRLVPAPQDGAVRRRRSRTEAERQPRWTRWKACAAMAAVEPTTRSAASSRGVRLRRRPALVVIDMAYGWTDPAYAGGSARLDQRRRRHRCSSCRPPAPRACRSSTPPRHPEEAAVQVGGRLLAEFPPVGPRDACDIDERLRPLADEYVIHKEHASAFAGTPLIGHLMAHGRYAADHRLLDQRLRARHGDRRQEPYLRPIIIREAVQDRSEIAHEWTLFDIQARFADVVSLDETLAYLRTV